METSQVDLDKAVLKDLTVDKESKIEDYTGHKALMVDFANEYIGGGASSFGNVQEEILFCIYPELFVAQLLCERMDPHEAIVITGVRKYSSYTGYGESLQYAKLPEKQQHSLVDSVGSTFIAIDAVVSDRRLSK